MWCVLTAEMKFVVFFKATVCIASGWKVPFPWITSLNINSLWVDRFIEQGWGGSRRIMSPLFFQAKVTPFILLQTQFSGNVSGYCMTNVFAVDACLPTWYCNENMSEVIFSKKHIRYLSPVFQSIFKPHRFPQTWDQAMMFHNSMEITELLWQLCWLRWNL